LQPACKPGSVLPFREGWEVSAIYLGLPSPANS